MLLNTPIGIYANETAGPTEDGRQNEACYDVEEIGHRSLSRRRDYGGARFSPLACLAVTNRQPLSVALITIKRNVCPPSGTAYMPANAPDLAVLVLDIRG